MAVTRSGISGPPTNMGATFPDVVPNPSEPAIPTSLDTLPGRGRRPSDHRRRACRLAARAAFDGLRARLIASDRQERVR